MTSGDKIKRIRQLRGWTQAVLASNMGLPLSRITQYEANVRNPKPSQLEEFARVLGVPVEFLTDHNIDTCRDIEHVLLELESTFGLEIVESDGKISIDFSDTELHNFLRIWAKAKVGSNIDNESKKNYELWKADYPMTYADECSKAVKAMQKKNQSKND